MAEAQGVEGEANRELTNNPEQTRDTQSPTMNPTVDLHKTDDIIIEEFVKRQGTIGLDWYVPDLCNTRVGILIKNRLPIYATQGRIIFNCPPLSEFFSKSNFELDLTTGWVYTFLMPPEDIGVPSQQEEFDLELLAEKLQKDPATSELRMEELELERIPLIRKIAAPADTMDLGNVRGTSCENVFKFQVSCGTYSTFESRLRWKKSPLILDLENLSQQPEIKGIKMAMWSELWFEYDLCSISVIWKIYQKWNSRQTLKIACHLKTVKLHLLVKR